MTVVIVTVVIVTVVIVTVVKVTVVIVTVVIVTVVIVTVVIVTVAIFTSISKNNLTPRHPCDVFRAAFRNLAMFKLLYSTIRAERVEISIFYHSMSIFQ